ncbi:hypothetical protein HGRIS_010163 [Hohenbuehelia grisea]|uniref:Protein ARV n=1 Tax=Hohenbuehelia grisea TaxID=104357 RepID=A0ABR3J4X1_9AGAR
MPICTTCTAPISHLYTVYESAYNLRLEECKNCHSFADPYVEHDSLTLLLDLILLKRGVYRHLLYNRGSEPRKVTVNNDTSAMRPVNLSVKSKSRRREQRRWWLVLRLGGALIFLDAFIRWTHLTSERPAGKPSSDMTPWTREMSEAFLRIFLGCLAETTAFHAGISGACYVTLVTLEFVNSLWRGKQSSSRSGVREEFRYSLIPLSLLYSSLTKLFLLFLLSIWRPGPAASRPISPPRNFTLLPFDLGESLFMKDVFELLDDDQLDRAWIVRNVLGGMSAGFGLRVILDCHPIFTSIIVLAGWATKTAVAQAVSLWVGFGRDNQQPAWLPYSIP